MDPFFHCCKRLARFQRRHRLICLYDLANVALSFHALSLYINNKHYRDPSGKLNFNGKAILHADGVDFSNGNSFKINMEELKLLEELGKGQYGTVQKVYHKPTNVTMAMKVRKIERAQIHVFFFSIVAMICSVVFFLSLWEPCSTTTKAHKRAGSMQ